MPTMPRDIATAHSTNESWRYIAEERILNKKQGCRHIYAEKGKSYDLVLIFHKGKFNCMGAWCSHMGE